MIVITRKVDYAILSLYHLMGKRGGVSARELASCYGLSRPFIANILKQLCQQGLVESQRGVHGGYRLARPPGEISLEMIITAMDGPFQLLTCSDENGPHSCGLTSTCPVKSPLRVVHERLRATLAKVTLEDLGHGEQALEPLLVECH